MSEREPDVFKSGDHYRGYVVERVLGRGGVGEVYLVRHEMLDTLFALKILYPGVARRDPSYVKRFLREAKLAIRVRHPNLVAVHDCGYDEVRDLYFLVMDYVVGGDMRSALAFAGKFSPDRAARTVLQVASALDAAQKYQVVHRDIKPENIMLQPDGTVKLVDLGIAKAQDIGETLSTMSQSTFGTPAYISPEQALDSGNVDCRADIYSLGIVFFEMVTGTNPYTGGNPAQILARVLSDEPTPDVRDYNPEVPDNVAVLIRRMCQKDRERRLPNFTVLLKELDRLGYDYGSAANAHVEYAEPAREHKTVRIGQYLSQLPENNPTLSFDTKDVEIQQFVSELKRRKAHRGVLGFLRRMVGR